ncbi:hypothetical protein [Agathobaculum butyriciproducens]|uniref:hypothetical protein n=1 Tax=Agathobaculum butyriciproducens TaxID=1628085 RepID=UPI003A8D6B16
MNKKLIAALCCAALLVPVASAEDYISKDAPFYEALMQAAEQSEQLALGDYGPEAETDFETKRDAYLSGFESGVEYSRDSDDADTSYSNGYDKGYEDGYREGYAASDTAPDSDIIDRSEVHTAVHDPDLSAPEPEPKKQTKISITDHIELLMFGTLGIVVLLALIVSRQRR